MLYKIMCDGYFACGGYGRIDAKRVVSEYIKEDKIEGEKHHYDIIEDDFKS